MRFIFFLSLIAAVPAGIDATVRESSLFEQDAPLKLDFVMDKDALCRRPTDDCDDAPAELHYTDTSGRHRVAANIRVRGRWKPDNGNCRFPALFVFFSQQASSDPVFAGQDMLPLTTHCQTRRQYEQYVLKEYLAYRIFNVLTDKSLRVRLASISYREPGDSSDSLVRYGFFTEHFRSMARRHAAELWQPKKFDPFHGDAFELAVMDLFQFMIGNTDWSAIYQHNIVLIRDRSGLPTAVPFDLDFSGLVAAEYAGPSPNLRLKSVKQRMFRGICRPDTDWQRLFAHFQSKRAEISALVHQVPDLAGKHRKRAAGYLDRFYKILDDPKQREKKIVSACRG